MIKELLINHEAKKEKLGQLYKDYTKQLKSDPDFIALKQELKDSREAMNARKETFISSSPSLTQILQQMNMVREELKESKANIKSNLSVTDKVTGEVVQMEINF